MPIHNLDKDCLFCKMILKKIPCKIVYEDETCLAFEDINPQAPVHILLIPKTHLPGLADLGEEDAEILASMFSLVSRLAEEKKIKESGFRTVVNTGKGAGQTVFHLHIHLLGGRGFRWPPG